MKAVELSYHKAFKLMAKPRHTAVGVDEFEEIVFES
jgi:hypothetical protein